VEVPPSKDTAATDASQYGMMSEPSLSAKSSHESSCKHPRKNCVQAISFEAVQCHEVGDSEAQSAAQQRRGEKLAKRVRATGKRGNQGDAGVRRYEDYAAADGDFAEEADPAFSDYLAGAHRQPDAANDRVSGREPENETCHAEPEPVDQYISGGKPDDTANRGKPKHHFLLVQCAHQNRRADAMRLAASQHYKGEH